MRSKILQFSSIALSVLLASGTMIRMIALYTVDMRYKLIYFNPFSPGVIFIGILLTLIWSLLSWQFISSKYEGDDLLRNYLIAATPLLGWVPGYFMQPNFAGLLWIIFCGALHCGLVMFYGKINFNISRAHAAWFVVITALLTALGGWYMQCYSLDKMAMQWLDWGHFYESLVNTLDGKFFYLNMGNACYLYSRFCVSLLVLLPVVIFRNVELFLLVGALCIASGGIIIYAVMRRWKFSPQSGIIAALWFAALPLTVNLLLPLLDGFHEVFLLVPSVLGAWYFYRRNRILPAALLVLFTLGLRETIGFMWAGYAVVLFLQKERKKGTILFAVSIFMLIFLLGFLMPYLKGGGNYEHTVFFPHLGNSIREIALSPFCKPALFFGTLFKSGNWIFWGSLLLPFVWTIWKRPLWLLPMLPDLVMVSLDYRFDSQNILRHYQIVPYIVLIIAALEGLLALRRNQNTRKYCNAALAAMLATSLGSCWCFTQIPGFPASDRRLPEWSFANGVLNRFFHKLPPGVKVTASPRIASHLVNRNDVFIYRGNEDSFEPLQDYVFIESFNPEPESILRRKLLQRPNWSLIHQEYLDERLLQLYKRTPGSAPMMSAYRHRTAGEAEFARYGMPIPSSLPQVQMRGTVTPGGYLAISARLAQKVTTDLGFAVEIISVTGEKVRYFQSFGNGVYPADLASIGEVFTFMIKLDSPVKSCKVDILVLK